ncbi:MAG: hypothetical protein KDE19_22225, partial [Caldilineaceae bacterium]|nr:hypothetical protein [Caldilineaceae bacterium]
MRVIPIIQLGVGGVGAALVRQILANREFHGETYGLQLQYVALCDSNGAVIESHGMADDFLETLLAWKAEGKRLADHEQGGKQNNLAAIVDIAGRDGAVVVDCTASDNTVPALTTALDRGYSIALANKKPLTVNQEVYTRLTSAGATRNRDGTVQPAVRHLGRSRWETTVGAGLPVIATLNRLV